jgi:hypothetical protein
MNEDHSEKSFRRFNNIRQRLMLEAEIFIKRLKEVKDYDNLEEILLIISDEMENAVLDVHEYKADDLKQRGEAI